MAYYSAIKKNLILPSAATWMDLEDIKLKGNKSDRKRKYYMLPLTCRI